MAETLITLAIIGVVAALTIPVLVGKYQKHQLYTQFMKTYNTLQTAYQLSVAENGEPDTWDNSLEGEDWVKKYFADYLKVASYCTGDAQACGFKENSRGLNGNESVSFASDILGENHASFILQDGTLVSMHRGDGIYIDVNGGAKGPNVWGRDLFWFLLDNNTPNGDYKIYPLDLYKSGSNNAREYSTLDDVIADCSTEESSSGSSCAARLLLEGKMNY